MKKLAYMLVIGSTLLVAGCGDKAEVAPATKAPSSTGAAAATTSEASPSETSAADSEGWETRESDINLDEGLDPAQVAAMSDAERESNFLALLDQQMIFVGSDETTLRVAQDTCGKLDGMSVGDDITPVGMQLVDQHGLVEYDAGKFIGMSTVFYCPENMAILGY